MPSRIELPPKECLNCGKIFDRTSCKRLSDYREKKFCCPSCYSDFNSGERHWNWIGRSKRTKDGYIRITTEKNKRRYEHRIVMENLIGRKLTADEHIHHLNGDSSDNSINNLVILSNSEHRKLETIKAERGPDGRFK